MLKVGLIGYGYWGVNLARVLADTEGVELVAVCDAAPARREAAAHRHGGAADHPRGVIIYVHPRNMLDQEPEIAAVVIATPPATHYPLAMQAIRAGKNVLVEKPLATTAREAAELDAQAQMRGITLMVDHTFLFTPAVEQIERLAREGTVGTLQTYDAVRVNLGLFQRDVNVLWDLAVHDLAILDFIAGRHAVAVSATGIAHLPGRPVDTAHLTLFYADDLLAHVHVSWLSPVKVRRTLIGGDRRMIVWDDLEPDAKIKVYDCGVGLGADPADVVGHLISYRTGDMHAPHLEQREALKGVVAEFRDAVVGNRPPRRCAAHHGRRVVETLTAADKSLALRGAPVEIEGYPS